MLNSQTKNHSGIMIDWAIFSTILLVIPFVYYAAKLGFFNFSDNNRLITVPTEILQLSTENEAFCSYMSRKGEVSCLIAKYKYHYNGVEYTASRVSSGDILLNTTKAEIVMDKIRNNSTVYINAQKPNFSVLIKRKDTIRLQPLDTSKIFFSKMTIPVVLLGLLAFFLEYRSHSATKSIKHKLSSIFYRLLSTWVDVVVFLSVVGIYIMIENFFILSPYHAENLLPFNTIPLAFLLFNVVLKWLFRTTIGQYTATLVICDATTQKQAGRIRICCHYILSYVGNIGSLGTISLFAAFDKNKQSVIDKFFRVIIVRTDNETK